MCKLFRTIFFVLLYSTSNAGFATYHWLTSYRQEMSETIGVCLPILKKFDKFQKPFVDQLCICSEVNVLLLTNILLLAYALVMLPCLKRILVMCITWFCHWFSVLFFSCYICCAVLIVKPILDDDDDNLLMTSTKIICTTCWRMLLSSPKRVVVVNLTNILINGYLDAHLVWHE